MKHKRFRETVPGGIDNAEKLSEAFAAYLDGLLDEDHDDPEIKELVKQSTDDFTVLARDLMITDLKVVEAAKKPFKDDLVKENEQLKKQVEELTKQLDEINEAEKKKAKTEAAQEVMELMKKLGTAGLIGTASTNANEVMCKPDEEIGVYAIGSALTVEPWRDVPKGEVGFVARMEVALGVLYPERIYKININS